VAKPVSKKAPAPVAPIIVKKVVAAAHAGHHGGAWKVAYADFVTAMMAFFLLLWIVGATTEKQRKGIADYFSPTLVEMREKSAGANGPFGGASVIDKDHYPNKAQQTGTRSITIPKDATGSADGAAKAQDRTRFGTLRRQLIARMKADKGLSSLIKNVHFTETREGLRIDLVDQADFTMFRIGTADLLPRARALLDQVARTAIGLPNPVMLRGHTDALPYAAGRTTNNWTLSAARAEMTRQALWQSGVAAARFARIEGVADREPFVPQDRYDPRNRRLSITLGWAKPLLDQPSAAEDTSK
jgi:chemotaxis protein MotB